MANYYVSKTTGNNSNNGTSPTTPWRDLSKVFEFGSPVNTNDTVYVAPGYYFENNIDVYHIRGYSIVGDVNCDLFPKTAIQPGDIVLARASFMTNSGTGSPFSINDRTSGITFRNITFANDSYGTFSGSGELTFGVMGFRIENTPTGWRRFINCKFIYIPATGTVANVVFIRFDMQTTALIEFDSCSFITYSTSGVNFIRVYTTLLVGSGISDIGLKIKNCSFFHLVGSGNVISLFSGSDSGAQPFIGGIEVSNCIHNCPMFEFTSLGGYLPPGPSSTPIALKNNIQITNAAFWSGNVSGAGHSVSANNFRFDTTSSTSLEPYGVYALRRARSATSNESRPSRIFLCNERPVGALGDKYIMHMLTPSDINTLPNECAYSVSPASLVEDNTSGTRPWSNLGNARVWNSSFASCSSLNSSNKSLWLKWTNFGFNIPSDAVITGATAHIMCYGSASTCRISSARLVLDNTISGSDLTTNQGISTTAHVSSISSFGSVTSTGGLSLTPSDVNSTGFGIAAQFDGSTTTNVTANVGGVRLVIYYRMNPVLDNPPDAVGCTVRSQLVETDPGVSTSLSSVGPVVNQNSGIPAVIQFSGEQSARNLIMLRGHTCHTLYFPVTNSQTTISIEIRRNSAYTGLMPGMRLLSGLGVSEQTAQMTASADTWQTISIGPFTPNSSGVMRVVLFSYDTSSNGEVYFDNFSAT